MGGGFNFYVYVLNVFMLVYDFIGLIILLVVIGVFVVCVVIGVVLGVGIELGM